jgi:8-oxo-dGTP pyrophosphatase MutT (NUDIX family)
MVRPAALAIVPDGKGRFLTVNRPEPPYEMSIPGGTVEPGESERRAALRELYEETNVVGDSSRLVWVASSPTDGRPVYVFLVPRWHGIPYSREGGIVAWMSPRRLVEQGIVYGDFVAAIFRGLPSIMGPSAFAA